ncbi:MAG TPA: amylo-alpha-1,6-glucosidase [Candidatus Bathyarchaeia archaeon]|nr:amylo-alpha-1,6-glucosidase [Candidatus Bathyarchaeia archaeon]
MQLKNPYAEWLEPDGLGGFASGTVSGIRTRRYHALLLTATQPPTGRFVLVNGLEVWIERRGEAIALSSQRYAPDVIHPDGCERIERFEPEPWPKWTFRLDGGVGIEHELFVKYRAPIVALAWRCSGNAEGLVLCVRPLFSGRDYHALHHENPSFRFAAETLDEWVTWRPYEGVPGILAMSNGQYSSAPEWYRNFLYLEERARGLDDSEDLASPGVFRFDVAREEAVLILAAEGRVPEAALTRGTAAQALDSLRVAERSRRRRFPSRLHRAADAYLVSRAAGKTIVAGYPWFTDWGRDTFIALRGLCLATGRLDEARDILLEWSASVSQGMLPNRFPDRGELPEFNSVDASLWYVIAVHDLERTLAAAERPLSPGETRTFRETIEAILAGYAAGTRFGIRLDDDGLLCAGEPGVQLTWMDAKVGDWVVTPRIGKPVEVEALWLNALRIGSAFSTRWAAAFARGHESFRRRFWNEAGCLHDVVDPDHRPGAVDATFRPNQILAVGGLPCGLLSPGAARRVVDAVEARLLTPFGLRSLAPSEPGYRGRYEGGVRERDSAYHQGTVWPWLLGPFVEAWVRVRGGTLDVKRQARQRFLEPLYARLEDAGIGHIAEIADGDPPHTPRGCPFQAWSLGEALRLDLVVLAEDNPGA